MRKILKWAGIILGSLLALILTAVVIIFGLGWMRFNQTYEVSVTPSEIPTDDAALARGEYLINGVAHCGYCHGPQLAATMSSTTPVPRAYSWHPI